MSSGGMYPNSSSSHLLAETVAFTKTEEVEKRHTDAKQYKWDIVWRNVLAFTYLHLGAAYGLFLAKTEAKLATNVFSLFILFIGGVSITAGAHRLWSHKAYKAKWPLRLAFVILQSMSLQNHVYEWVRDHRVHHKFTDTDADPHNSKRGFFFSHMGWLCVRKHKDVIEKGKTVPMADLEQDWIVMLQKKYYIPSVIFFCFLIPTWIPVYFWNEKAWTAWYVAFIARYTVSLHAAWLVNSAAHLYGTRPYDRAVSSRENLPVSVIAFGEGWHNYHHTFPWDYKASEYSSYRANWTTGCIDFFSKIGLAYSLKSVPDQLVQARWKRTGDGSQSEIVVWGWDDGDLTDCDKKLAKIK